MSQVAPHTCPGCGSPAYIGFATVQCVNSKCEHFDKESFIEYALEMYAEEDEPQVEFEITTEPHRCDLRPSVQKQLDIDEDADTQPKGFAAGVQKWYGNFHSDLDMWDE